jgi:hypothetical protein
MNALQRLNHLERLYGGPIPPWQLSPPNVFALNSARENMRLMTQLVRKQISGIRARRSLGWPDEEYMINDLRLYLHQRRRYQAEVIRLGRGRA